MPGKTAAVFSARRTGQAVAQFFFAAPGGQPLEFDYRNPAQQQKILASVFADVGWHVPDLLGQLPAADEFYFDSVRQVQLGRWSSGRVALTGDAGYVLAGELAAAGGHYRAEKRIAQRDRFFRMLPYLPPARLLVKYLSTRTATAIKLPEYSYPPLASGRP